jgi:hypothetical protein
MTIKCHVGDLSEENERDEDGVDLHRYYFVHRLLLMLGVSVVSLCTYSHDLRSAYDPPRDAVHRRISLHCRNDIGARGESELLVRWILRRREPSTRTMVDAPLLGDLYG